MREFDYDSDWSLRLGEVNIVDGDNQFTLVVGYGVGIEKDIYIRLFTVDDELVRGTWITKIGSKDDFAFHQHAHLITDTLLEKIKEQARRLERLKAFA